MRIEIRFIHVDVLPAAVEHVQRHAGFALGRFSQHITRLMVRFQDVNGPRGGVDKTCLIQAHGRFGVRTVQAHGHDLYVVSLRALDMLERSIRRALKRRATLATASETATFVLRRRARLGRQRSARVDMVRDGDPSWPR